MVVKKMILMCVTWLLFGGCVPMACEKSLLYEEFLKEASIQGNHSQKQQYAALIKKRWPGYAALSQTEIHLARHFNNKYMFYGASDPLVVDMCHCIIHKELQEAQKGRYTLIHGQPWFFQLLEDVYTVLWQKIHDIQCSKYIFARFRRVSLSEKDLKKHIHMCQNLVDGRAGYIGYAKSGEFALCVNFGLFCNYGSTNSFEFFRDNNASTTKYLNLEHIFKQLDLEKYYSMFQSELEALVIDHQSLTSYGHILMFSLDAQTLNKIVYPSDGSYGFLPYCYIDSSVSNVQELFNRLRDNELSGISDENYHFCITLSKDCGLIPENGVDVYEFNAVDKKKMQAFERKKKVLLDKIILNMDYDMAKEPTNAQKRMQAMITKVMLWKKFGCLISGNHLWDEFLKQNVNFASPVT